jgi:hypothetical protein
MAFLPIREQNMAQDPLSHVASWLTPAGADDPVIVLGREHAAIIDEMDEEAADQARMAQLAQRADDIEAEIAKLVPRNIEAILLQARS